MIACALVIGLALTSQLSAADNGRYPLPSAGPPAADAAITPLGSDSNSAGNTPLGTGRSPFNTTPPPATGVGAANPGVGTISPPAAAPPAGAGLNPLRGTPPTGGTPPRTLQNLGDTQPLTDTNSNRSTPAAYDVPATTPVNNGAQAGVRTPSGLMRAMLVAPTGSQLRGQPVSLVEVVGGARSRADQTQRVEAYWDLCSSVADYYLGLLEREELQRYIQRGVQGWDRVDTDMQNRTATSLRAALASQMRVASFMGRGPGYLPLPTDTPHCASYNAHFERIFPQGAPAEARELAALLPLRYKELRDASDDVTKSEQYLNSFAQNRGTGGDDGLHALGLLALQRRAFVQIARDYNRRIARYSELASPGQVSSERLIGMLIKSGATSTATKSALPAPLPNRQSNNDSSPPSTFAEGSPPAVTAVSNSGTRDDAVRPASGSQPSLPNQSGPRREHSLLVPTP